MVFDEAYQSIIIIGSQSCDGARIDRIHSIISEPWCDNPAPRVKGAIEYFDV
jgi:hypothetical protein